MSLHLCDVMDHIDKSAGGDLRAMVCKEEGQKEVPVECHSEVAIGRHTQNIPSAIHDQLCRCHG